MAEYDLTTKIGSYLDRHLAFPLLEFLSGVHIYDEQDLEKGKVELLSHTNMLDFAMDIYKQLHGDEEVPEYLLEKRRYVVEQLREHGSKTEPVVSIFEQDDVKEQMKTLREGKQLFDYIAEKHNFKMEDLDAVYKYGKFQYECGNYTGAAETLYIHRVLVQPDDKHYMDSLWGKVASEILMQNWDTAWEDLHRLQECIDANTIASPLQLLQQRTWLIHWSLFVFFNHAKGRDEIIELFLHQKNYLNAIQTMCPWILRYVTTAVIISKRRRQVLKDLVKVIQQESYTYRDPVTEFIECLYIHFDFDKAQEKLRECETVLANDFFLVACRDDFIENARLFIFETFCRIHQCISIEMLAEKLNMSEEDAEQWIVNLIRNAKLNAKIDSKKGHVIMGTQAVSPYQQVIEKTKTLAFRSQMLATNVERRLNKNKERNDSIPHWANAN